MDKIEERKSIIESLLTNLQVLNSVDKCEKLSVKNTGELDVDKRYFQSFRRYFSGDSREVLLIYLSKMFASIDSEIEFLIVSYKNNTCEILHEYVTYTLHDFYIKCINARKGLINLIDTYDEDISVKSKLEIYLNVLDRKSLSLRQKLGIKD
jgi:hypothetical protein